MEFNFELPTLVEEKKKYANFTIREIGGPDDIIKWRQQQEAKESLVRLRLAEKDQRLESFEKELDQPLSRGQIATRSWGEKQAFAESERKRIAELEENVIQHPAWEPLTKPKKNLLQRIRDSIAGIWKSANFN